MTHPDQAEEPLDGAALAAAFRTVRPEEDRPALEEALTELGRAARSAWPGVRLPMEALARALAENGGSGLENLRASDLYLARACLAGDAAALRLLETQVLSRLRDTLARVCSSPAQVDDALQRVRERLLMGEEDGRPRLREYGGQGSLVNWVRAVAVRLALNLRRGDQREVPTDDATLADLPLMSGDLELSHLRARHREDFAAAFQEALASLSAQERNALRLNLVDRLNIEQIGAVYGVHRATVARWIARAKEDLAQRTRQALSRRLQLSPEELESLMELVDSQLDLSINRFLREA